MPEPCHRNLCHFRIEMDAYMQSVTILHFMICAPPWHSGTSRDNDTYARRCTREETLVHVHFHNCKKVCDLEKADHGARISHMETFWNSLLAPRPGAKRVPQSRTVHSIVPHETGDRMISTTGWKALGKTRCSIDATGSEESRLFELHSL